MNSGGTLSLVGGHQPTRSHGYLLTTVGMGSLSAVSRPLRISQAPLSRGVSEWGARLNVPLIVRGGRKQVPVDARRDDVALCRQIMEDIE